MKKETSVILAAYNALPYTQQCIGTLRSCLAGETYEIIAIDNGSTDGTYPWLSMQPDIHVLRNEENLGLAAAWNQGLAIAVGRDLLFLHNDVVLSKNALRKMREVLWGRDDIGAVRPYTNRCEDSWGQVLGISYRTLDDIQNVADQVEQKFQADLPRMYLDSVCFLAKRSVAMAAGGFDESYRNAGYEAMDFSLQVLKAGYFLAIVNTYVHHEMGSFAGNGLPRDAIQQRNYSLFREKWHFAPDYSMNVRFELLQFIDANAPGLCVLDVGCSCGGNLMWMKYHNPTAELHGIELNPSAASVASTFAQVDSQDVETLVREDWQGKFDYIIMADVIEHLREPWNTLKTMASFLKPTGKLVISIPNINHVSILMELLHGSWQYVDAGILDRTHLRFFTRQSFTEYLQEAGLQASHTEAHLVTLPESMRRFMDALLAADGIGASKEELQAYQWYFVAEKAQSQET